MITNEMETTYRGRTENSANVRMIGNKTPAPPILGVGVLWKLRSLGRSSHSLRIAKDRAHQTPMAPRATLQINHFNISIIQTEVVIPVRTKRIR